MTTASLRRLGLRRSKLVAKGGTWEAIAAANASGADVIHIELEAGFPPEHRPAAVETTCKALREMDWSHTEAWVRFRHVDTPETLSELAAVIAARPHLVYCAKVKTAEDLHKLDRIVTQYEKDYGIEMGSIQIGAVIERLEALKNVDAIANASPRMGALMFGANDMSLDVGYRRTNTPELEYETLYIRSQILLAGRLAKIDIFDGAYMDRTDLEGSEAGARFSARMGFSGKTALSAAQVPGIHRAFVPTQRELAWARDVLAAANGPDGSFGLVDDDVIDETDVARAQILIARAK